MAEECVSVATDSGVSVWDVDTNLVMKVLESQSWSKKSETARRLRGLESLRLCARIYTADLVGPRLLSSASVAHHCTVGSRVATTFTTPPMSSSAAVDSRSDAFKLRTREFRNRTRRRYDLRRVQRILPDASCYHLMWSSGAERTSGRLAAKVFAIGGWENDEPSFMFRSAKFYTRYSRWSRVCVRRPIWRRAA
jgi:hypothetical protein